MLNKQPQEIIYLMIIRDGEFIILPYTLDKLDFPMAYYDRDDVTSVPPHVEEEKDEDEEDNEEEEDYGEYEFNDFDQEDDKKE
jgi:hypothetical protein